MTNNTFMPKTHEIYILDIDYTVDEDGPIIRIFGRDDRGNTYVVLDKTFMPYFYLIPKIDADPKELAQKITKSKLLDENNNQIKIRSIEITEKNIDIETRKILKIYAMLPSDVPKLKNILKTLPQTQAVREYDILFYKRYMYDKGISGLSYITVCGSYVTDHTYNADTVILAETITPQDRTVEKLDILALDLETSPQRSGEQIIISAGLYSTSGKRIVYSYKKSPYKHQILVKDEKDLISKLAETLKDERYDFIATYNGDLFDFTVLNNQAKKHKISLNISLSGSELTFRRSGASDAAIVRGKPHLDIYKFVVGALRTSLKSNTYSLDTISQEVLGEKKDGLTYKDIISFWNRGDQKELEKLFQYNLRDCELTERLAKYFLPNLKAFCALTNALPADICRTSYGGMVEGYLLKRATELNYVVPNKPTSSVMSARKEQGKVKGAFVVEPIPGLHKNIAVFDFRSLYPTIIISHNISPSTFNCNCCKKEKQSAVPGKPYYFCTKKKALVPIILKDVLDTRSSVKKKFAEQKKGSDEYLTLYALQYGLKTLANAFYGYLGFPGSRFYKRECAESVTAFGRNYIHSTISMAKKHNLKAIYGDTDSIFLKFEQDTKDTKKTINTFLDIINKTLPSEMELEFEGLYRTGIFVHKKGSTEGAKKRYALLEDDGSVIIKGFENVRRDWSPLAKNLQIDVINLVLNGKTDTAVDHTKKVIEQLISGKVPLDDLIIYTKITKPLDKYILKGPHVIAAIKAAKKGVDINPGTTVGYIITKEGKSISDRAELVEFVKDYDSSYYLNNQLLPAVLRILEPFGITKESLLSESRQTGLSSFS